MKKFIFTIGDGMNQHKDFCLEWSILASDDELRNTVILVLNPDQDAESLIAGAEIDRDDESAVMIIDEGPNGECAQNGGPWLVAMVQEVES